ncbi:MAG: glutamate-1-semialdehyde 2,1-aminomutase [Candidatus Omnitrophica bacterium]|nr:glutamate-1-semialdehyde 2,1-aminomutase [Candidatus Omnitrophota bacterium]
MIKKNIRKKSEKYYKEALSLMPAGVNSPVRAFNAVGGNPVFIKWGKGSKIYDVDGNSYIDYVLSWGPLILGHAHKQVINSIVKAARAGTSFGAPTVAENEIARLIKSAIPGMQSLRLVNSGTEAAMSAIRLARSYTGKDKIIKFEGAYHGHSDGLLVKAGSGAAAFGVPTSSGVPRGSARDTIVLPFNDIEKVKAVIAAGHKNIAAVIIEPVCGNMGVAAPLNKFLQKVRTITRQYGILLIFDEVITGFRFCFGGAQNLLKIKPDITCLGKIIGGGMPIGAYGASKKIMDCAAPSGSMYQAGTLSGNPVAVACGLKTLRILKKTDYKKINLLCEELCTDMKKIAKAKKKKITVNRFCSMFTVFFTNKNVSDYSSAYRSDTEKYANYFSKMLSEGVYFAPSQFEANFLSFAHTKKDIEYTIEAFNRIITDI